MPYGLRCLPSPAESPRVRRDGFDSLQRPWFASCHRRACAMASGRIEAASCVRPPSSLLESQHSVVQFLRVMDLVGSCSCSSCRFWGALSANTPCFPRFKGQSPTNPERTKKTHDSCECLSIHRIPYQPTQSASLLLPHWKGYHDGLCKGPSL